MRRLVENDEHHGAERQQPQHQERDSSYSNFLATHPPVFADATDPLEVDSWLCTTESKFGLLHCTEYQKTMYVAQQLRGTTGAWWASNITTLPDDHHVPWGEFRTAFCAHHLFVGLLHNKLKEFLDFEQGNHSVFNYTRQFNTLAQYGTYHVDMDEKKANLYHTGLTIHLQEQLVPLSSLSYNELASATIDQERMMKAVVEADEKKRKRMMHGSTGSGSSSGAPPKYLMVYTPPGGLAASTTTVVELGPSPTIPTMTIPTATVAAAAKAAVQPCPYSTIAAGCHQATTIVSRQQLSMLQLQEDGPLCSRMLPV
jgi:hypothetical protein